MEEAAFLRLIAAAPDDDAPRLIYADWLDERGDPRGGFIRAQCALARLPADDPPPPTSKRSRGNSSPPTPPSGTHPLADRVDGWGFRRGFVEDVTLSAAAFLRARRRAGHGRAPPHPPPAGRRRRPRPAVARPGAAARPRARPVRQPPRRRRRGRTRAVAAPGEARSARPELQRADRRRRPRLLAGRAWPRLHTLDLRGNEAITGRSAAFLARATGLPALATLDLSDNRLDGPGVGALAHSPALPRLADLRVGRQPVRRRRGTAAGRLAVCWPGAGDARPVAHATSARPACRRWPADRRLAGRARAEARRQPHRRRRADRADARRTCRSCANWTCRRTSSPTRGRWRWRRRRCWRGCCG